MIVDGPVNARRKAATSVLRRHSYVGTPALIRSAAVLLAFLALAVGLQIASGAYHAEFNGYPDEPAHYVTSLMVRDYVTAPKPLAPMQFAVNFYDHYPKVAFGHWPPFFYVVQALWMILFSPSRVSVLWELAFTTALLAYAVYAETRRWLGGKFGWAAGVLAGVLTVCLPLVQTYTDEEMSETLLTLLCFWSATSFVRYVDSERWQDNLRFAIFFSLAVLTKGNGWLLALLAPLALLFSGKLRLFLRRSFWLPMLLVAALCIPWQVLTMQVAERGWVGGSGPNVPYMLSALGPFLRIFVAIIGPIPSLLVLVGICAALLPVRFRKPVPAGPAVMLALILAVWIFHSLVPAGIEDRKAVIAVPALILFLFAGGAWVADHLPLGGNLAMWRGALVAIAAGLIFCVQTFAIPHQRHYGYTEAAHFITSDPRLHGATVLVSSESGGEGLLISEIAMDEPRPSRVILRATKTLAHVDWNGWNYQSLFSTPSEVTKYLEQRGVQLVVLDTFAPQEHFVHNDLLRGAAQNSGRMHLLATFPAGSPAASGQVEVFEFNSRH
jgi:hypothetical protein